MHLFVVFLTIFLLITYRLVPETVLRTEPWHNFYSFEGTVCAYLFLFTVKKEMKTSTVVNTIHCKSKTD